MDELKDYIAKQKKKLAVFSTTSETDDRITITLKQFDVDYGTEIEPKQAYISKADLNKAKDELQKKIANINFILTNTGVTAL